MHNRPSRFRCRHLPAALIIFLIPVLASASPLAAERRTLSNGARLVVSEQRAVPMVVIQLLIDAGSRRDPAGKQGLASLTADLLTEGTKKRSAKQISQAVDEIGAELDARADVDYATLSLTVLSKDLDRGLELLFDILLQPSFPEAEVVRRREAALAAIHAEEDNPGRVAGRRFLEALFGSEPYGHPTIGVPASVAKLTRADVSGFYGKFYRPDLTLISIAGDVTADAIAERLERGLRSWRAGEQGPFVYPPSTVDRPQVVMVQKPLTQANVVLGHRGIARDDPDYYAVTVMNFILGGGGFTSRLMESVRIKGGLAYSVGSMFSVNKSPGSFQVVLQTKNASAGEAIQKACREIELIRQELVSEDELTGAKLYLTGSFPMRIDSNAKIAGFLAQVGFFGLGEDYADTYAARINAVSREDVRRVAQKYLRPEEMHLVVVGNLDEAKVPSTPPCRATDGS
jgi:zinc protease